MLSVIDEEQPDPGSFGGQQSGVGGQCLQGGADEIGGTQGRDGCLRRGRADRGAQQHHLFELLGKAACGHPLRAVGRPTDALQRHRVDATLSAAGQKVAQFGREAGRDESGP